MLCHVNREFQSSLNLVSNELSLHQEEGNHREGIIQNGVLKYSAEKQTFCQNRICVCLKSGNTMSFF